MRPHVLITGGSSGIGLACAHRYAARGYHISVLARRDSLLQAARDELLNSCADAQQQIVTIVADVSVRADVEKALGDAVERCGPVSLLITSAGVVQPGRAETLPITAYEDAITINYLGTVYAVQAAMPQLKTTGGHIVLIASGAGLIGIYGYSSYSPSKFALRGYAEALHAELRHEGVKVSIVYPPDTDTPQLAQENLSKPVETRMMTESAGVWSVDAVADKIIAGVDKGKFAITPGFELSVLHRCGGLLTPVLQAYWAWCVRRMHRKSR